MTPALRSALRSGARFAWPFALVILAGAGPLGCYKPKIKDGGLRCNMDAGTGKFCPEGFGCDMTTLTCWRNLDGGVDIRVDTQVDTPVDTPADTQLDMKLDVTCFDARANCTPDPGKCDPYCQTGCACGQKCSVNTLGALTCNQPRAFQFPRAVMDDCNEVILPDTPQQTDNCGPGLVCVNEGCFPRCFRFCRSDADCPGSSCTRDIGGQSSGHKVCDVPFMDSCVPLPSGQNTGCGPTTSTTVCYISSTNPQHTICDCPFNAVGSNYPCTRTRDCIKGLACVDRGDGSSPVCLQVCRRSMNGADCVSNPTPGACHPYTGIPAGQTPHPDFGFCL
jgi:hypothetical protein